MTKEAGILVLEDGAEFQGLLFGTPVSYETYLQNGSIKDFGYGEVVFNTSMTGYQEILTDPSYYGQMVCMTVPHIGNTGVNSEDPESVKPWCSGFIVHDYCDRAIHWRAEGQLDEYLKSSGIPGLSAVDTRALTRHLRSRGVIRGIILPEKDKKAAFDLLKKLPRFEGRDLIGEVTVKESYLWKRKSPTSSYKVIAMDFGIKQNLLRHLDQLNCEIEVVPAQISASEILSKNPDGIFLSNGPGDPTAAPYAVATVKELIGKIPIFGVCMGHQILALAIGGKTFKMKFGHRGGNQPVLDLKTQKVEISSHNHGYAVDASSLPPHAEITHLNLNDKTVEGMCIPDAKAFSVQYHPEACPGPHDSVLLFERFIQNMKTNVSKVS